MIKRAQDAACFSFVLPSGSEVSQVHFCPDSGAFGVNAAEELMELQLFSLWGWVFLGFF